MPLAPLTTLSSTGRAKVTIASGVWRDLGEEESMGEVDAFAFSRMKKRLQREGWTW